MTAFTSSFAVGVDLGGTTIKAALVAQGIGIQHELSRPTEAEEGPAHVIRRMAEMVQALIERAPNREIAGVGIGAPGTVNWERTAVVYPPNLPGWGIVDLRKELQAALGLALPIFVENDANLAGLGSAHYGAGKPFDSFIMVTLGTGVGGAIIYRNRIFRGTTGGAGEIGHMSIDYEGPLDRYGIAGSIEAYIGQRFLSHYARYRLLTQRHSLVHQMAGEDLRDINPRILYEAAQAGDEPAREVLAWAGHKLGCVLAAAVNLLDIHKIVVGGGVSAAGDFILEPARQTLRRYVIPALRDQVEIVRETLGNEAGILGAAQLVFQLLEQPHQDLGT